jgi:penicillin-binding protein 2
MFEKEQLELPEVAATPGSDVVLTIDMDLQRVAKEAFKGKYGAVVAVRPENGEIVAMVSEPEFDPAIYQSGLSAEDWRSLINNPFHPLLDKTTGGEFPPGSVYKAVVAAAGLEEKVVDVNSTYFCPGQFTVGNQNFRCHQREGHGWVNVTTALMKSCDVYFYQIGMELGVDRIAKYAKAFGLGSKLGVALNMERPGLVPTSAWKKLVHRIPWATGETPPISIGQGYNLITPVQMATLYATLGNGGNIWRPHLVRRVVNHLGENIAEEGSHLIQKVEGISPKPLDIVRKGLVEVVMNEQGTGKNSRVEGIVVAGKTGSVQVVSLKKNHNQKDVSVKWKEHAMFAAFAPAENPEIAVAIVSENDAVGGGGASAAPVAGKILNAWFDLKKKRALGTSGQPVEEDATKRISQDADQTGGDRGARQ